MRFHVAQLSSITEDGYAITAYHVVKNANRISVRTAAGSGSGQVGRGRPRQ